MHTQPMSTCTCTCQAFHTLVREAKLSQSLPKDKVPILGRRHSAEPPSSQGEVNGKLRAVDSDDDVPAKAVLADGMTSTPRLKARLSMAGPAPAWPDQRASSSPSSEPDMTVEAATQLVLEGAMKWPYHA